MQTAVRSIPQIDKAIDAIHRKLCRLEAIDTMSAESWQDAWDKHPDLREKETALYRERGEAQQVRDVEANKEATRIARIEGAKQRKELAAKFKAQRDLEAAAPDLLEMTKLLARVAEYEIRVKKQAGDDEGARMTTITLNLALAAIAKAEGKQ